MKYIVERTSDMNNKIPPCEGVYKGKAEYIQTRTCSENYFNEHHSEREGLWRDHGFDHKETENGWITRRMEDVDVWFIDLNTMDDLMKFIENNGGSVVIEKYWQNEKDWCIEIYDGYRE